MNQSIITPHGGYRELKSFQSATIVYDYTVSFCDRYVRMYRMKDQMIQAARSGRQNIAEGCQVSGTSRKSEMKLVSVARASMEELLLDYEDFLRQRGLRLWGLRESKIQDVRALAFLDNRSYLTYRTYLLEPESAANVAVCLIHQTNYLLDRQLRALADTFVREGGFTERLYRSRRR